MPYTPILKRLNKKSTTFYTFGSASNDLSKCLGNTSTKEFIFSHFVCLNLPDIANSQRQGSASAPTSSSNTLDVNPNNQQKSSSYLVSKYLQDYVLNFEEHLLANTTISPSDSEPDKTPAERVFWHWLKETGAIDFTTATTQVTSGRTRYIENESDNNYKRVVQYIGDIDVTNNVDLNNEAYTEIYIHIPAESGNTPTVLFDSISNSWYEDSKTYSNTGSDQAYIYGQTSGSIDPSYDPSVVDVMAMYDNTPSYITGGVGQDCFCIDFDAESYNEIMTNASINTIQDFNKSTLADTFEFNTVLLYYDVLDVSSGKKTSNLYGVLFLSDVVASDQSNIPDYFQRFPKYKPVDGAYNGNSYGFKINLRIDLEPNKQGIHSLINEYNTFSMALFSDAIAKMQNCADTFVKLKDTTTKLGEKVSELETMMANVANYNKMQENINELQRELENANLAFADRNSLLELIAKNSDEIKKLANGTLTRRLQMNLDVVKPGYDIIVDTSNPEQVIINTKTRGYSLCPLNCLDTGEVINMEHPITLAIDGQSRTTNAVYTYLQTASNMLRFYNEVGVLADEDIVVYINDSMSTWQKGQNMKISFPTLTLEDLNDKNIVFLTDYNNKNGNGSYGIKDVVLFGELKSDHPVIELICLDETMSSEHSIVHDILR